MPPSHALLLDALRRARRRYRMPPLPADADAARAAGTDALVAFAIAHRAQDLFLQGLAGLIRTALAPATADAAFQAQLLRSLDADVDRWLQLEAQAAHDLRAVRSSIDAIAHPGKLRAMPESTAKQALMQLHALAEAAAWADLRHGVHALQDGRLDHALRAVLEALLASPALARLEQAARLRASPGVQRYLQLCARRGPAAGSEAALAQGRAAARAGNAAEAATVQALRAAAALLDTIAPGHHVARGLRTPRGFPGGVDKAKDEWDAMLLHGRDVLLLVEVKASPAAASTDFPRLLRGLQRLALAQPGATYYFPSGSREVAIDGASLQALQPGAQALPPHAIYCCTAAAEAAPPWLAAASKSVLASEASSLAYAQALARGEQPRPALLLPAWEALATAPRLRPTLYQYETARAVREAMLHPDDLLAALADAAGGPN